MLRSLVGSEMCIRDRITYYTPRVNGFQLGVSYAPWAGEDGGAQFDRNANMSYYVSAGAYY